MVKLKPIPGKEWDGRKVPIGLFTPSYVGAWIGKTGSGKSTSMLNMLQEYQSANTFDKKILFSPSARDDPKYNVIEWDQVYEDWDEEALRGIFKKQEEDMEEWKEYLKQKLVYDKFKKGVPLTKGEKRILFGLINGEGVIAPPQCSMEREPYGVIVFDDLGSSDAYKNVTRNFMAAMACRCRHKNLSMFHCLQHIYQLPRTIRQQCGIMALFRTKDQKLLREIAKENSSDVTEDEFVRLYDAATKDDKHDFLLADFLTETFRKNYDNLLTL